MRIQVYADVRSRPPDPLKRLQISFPGIGPALALAVDPLKQDSRQVMPVA